ncbi:MAG: alkaline phytoceramidase [Candidatus Acidiferrales bacterium]
MKSRVWILLAAIGVAVAAVFCFPAIPQSEAYHNFADKRVFFGVPNALNALSNVFFLFVGILGMRFSLRDETKPGRAFIDSRERWPYFVFFVGIALTAFGSTYYHIRPNDSTLVWDRIPMAIGFMALVAAVTAERLSVRFGASLLAPLAGLGVGSVLYWHFTQAAGDGDLRFYAIAQFGSLLAILLILALFPPRYTRGSDFIIALAIYGIAKIFEAADRQIFALVHIISGHTLKHLAAALSAYWIFRMLRLRVPVTSRAAVVSASAAE